jgi:GxxExxY protein
VTNLSKYANKVYKIIGASMTVHSELGYGLLEPIYQEALHLELLDRGIANDREIEIPVYYKKHLLEKKYRMDILVDDIIIELKSVTNLVPAHRAQLCNYLRLTRKPLGLLINFGEESLIGERWAYDADTNECFIVDRNMEPIDEADYSYLLNADEEQDN